MSGINPGSTRYGYVDPNEKAWEMLKAAIESYVIELKKYQGLEMDEEAKKCCMGILKGIYKFEKESKNEFKDWATDALGDNLKRVFGKWKEHCTNQNDIKEIKYFIKKYFPGWEIPEDR